MDFRYAIRVLAKSPSFTAVAILTLALGIGVNTVVFTLFESVALKPLEVRAPGEMARIFKSGDSAFSFAEYTQLREQATSFTSVTATSAAQSIVCVLPGAGQGESEVIRARLVSGNYFEALGVSPPLGRAFSADESMVVVASHAFWRRRLHSDPAIVGKTIVSQSSALTILGVAPETFAGTGLPPQAPDVWIPLSMQRAVLPGVDWLRDNAQVLQILARRKPGVAVEQVSAELDVLGRAWPPVDGQPIRLSAKNATFFQTDTGEYQVFGTVSLMLMVVVGLILLIGCVNLVNLLVARNAARQHEIAVRLALGASRFRLIRLLCAESILLGVLGGAAGLLLSIWSCQWIHMWIVETLQRVSNGLLVVFLNVTPDLRVLTYTVIVSLLTGVAVGV